MDGVRGGDGPADHRERIPLWDSRLVMLKACLNGGRDPREHDALPVTATELATDARHVLNAGAQAVHLHVKDDAGKDTFGAASTNAAIAAVRAAAPRLRIGVTTGAWAEPDPAARVSAIRSWSVLPDFASVNWHEPGAEYVARCLLDRGIAVEAGLWHGDAVAQWLASSLRARCLRVLVELPDGLSASRTAERADILLRMLDGIEQPILLHGEGSSCWPALEHARDRGLSTRVGLEDTLVMSDGSPAADNAALIAEAVTILGAGL